MLKIRILIVNQNTQTFHHKSSNLHKSMRVRASSTALRNHDSLDAHLLHLLLLCLTKYDRFFLYECYLSFKLTYFWELSFRFTWDEYLLLILNRSDVFFVIVGIRNLFRSCFYGLDDHYLLCFTFLLSLDLMLPWNYLNYWAWGTSILSRVTASLSFGLRMHFSFYWNV